MSDSTKILAKQAVGDIIRLTLPKAVTWDWWVIGKGIGVSLPELETIREDTFFDLGTRFVHAYCIGIATLPREHVANNLKFRDNFTLKIWGFYQHVTGVRDKNSEDEFIKNLEKIQDALSNAPKLVYNSVNEGVEGVNGHHQLTFDDEIETYGFSKDKKIWIARGTLVVDTTKQLGGQ